MRSLVLSLLFIAGSAQETEVKTPEPWTGPVLNHTNGKKLTAGGVADYTLMGEGADQKADIFTTLTITFDEKTGIADEWDYSVVWVCQPATTSHNCIYFDF